MLPAFNRKSDNWTAFRKKFELVADHYRLSEEQRLRQLLVRIKEGANKVLLIFGEPRPLTYSALLTELDSAFGLSAERCRRELPSRKPLRGETLDHLADDVLALLVETGYSGTSAGLREAEKDRYVVNKQRLTQLFVRIKAGASMREFWRVSHCRYLKEPKNFSPRFPIVPT